MIAHVPRMRLYALTGEDAADELLTNTTATLTAEVISNDKEDPDETENDRAERFCIRAVKHMSNDERKNID
jgi:hypothetical protein